MSIEGTSALHGKPPKPMVLLILDGFGCAEPGPGNAISMAKTPVWDRLWTSHPHTTLDCSGLSVGLPEQQMGNSEVGHLHLGAGRPVPQDFTRIATAAENSEFLSNPVLSNAVDKVLTGGKALHLLGLLSPGGVHSHEKQIHKMVELAVKRGLKEVYIHAFLDGRDTPPKSAAGSIRTLEDVMCRLGGGRIASLIGRFYAMDRDHRWDRIEHAYDLIVRGAGAYRAGNALEGLEMAYLRGETDEFVQATAVVPKGRMPVGVAEGDVVVFMNFRADRARELTRAITEARFDGFERKSKPELGMFVTLTQYHEAFDFPVAFPPLIVKNSLGEVFSKLGLKQLRLAETEKYAHVTFFFNGGLDAPFEGETRILVPSPKVRTYDLQPEMSVRKVTDILVDAITGGTYDVIICNYANCDMVGHTGKLKAAVSAVEAIDRELGRVLKALDRAGGRMLLTADHGNAEKMLNPRTGEAHTAHTVNPVPLVYYGGDARLLPGGTLADVAPTLLDVMGIDKPREMTCRSLIA